MLNRSGIKALCGLAIVLDAAGCSDSVYAVSRRLPMGVAMSQGVTGRGIQIAGRMLKRPVSSPWLRLR